MTGSSGASNASGRAQDRDFFIGAGIPDADIEKESIELRFRERIRPFLLDRILRREYEERLGQRHRPPGRCDAMLLHRLEQGGLRARRRAVDLIGEDDVREDHDDSRGRRGDGTRVSSDTVHARSRAE